MENTNGLNVVLVHGGFVDGSGWEGVHKILTRDGHHVSIVQNPTLSLADDVMATRRVIDAQDGPVVLVGHSYGGAVITEAGNDPKVTGLVYIAAFGAVKAATNYVAGALWDRLGRKPVLVAGWLVGVPVPLLLISPFARRNFVDHSLTDQSSILRFIEDNWSLGRIGNGSADAIAGSLNGMFDFSHPNAGQLILDAQSGQPTDGHEADTEN